MAKQPPTESAKPVLEPLAANDLAIKAAKPAMRDGRAQQVEYRIDGTRGLVLRVEKSGKASYYFRYRTGGDVKRVRIGARDVMSFKDARAKASALIASVDQGEDPRATQAAANDSTPLRQAWEERKADNDKAKGSDKRAANTIIGYDYGLKNVIFPVLGDTPIAKITREQMGVVLQKAKTKHGVGVVHNARAGIGNLYKWAGRAGYVSDDLARSMRTLHGIKKSERRERSPTAEEIGKLWNHCGAILADNAAKHTSRQLATALRLMLLIPQRNSEVLGARLDEFHGLDTDKPVWRIKGARMKVKTLDQSLALSPEAVAVVKVAMAQGDKDRTFLFPANNPVKPFHYSSASAFMQRAREGLKIEGLTIHDFRRGWNDWAVMARVDRGIRDRVLHHAPVGVTETNYTTVDYAELTREPMQRWGAHVVQCAEQVKVKAIAA